MNLKQLPIIAVSGLLFILMSTNAHAEALALSNLQTYSGVNPIQTSCSTCHSTIPALNSFGTAFRSAGGVKSAYTLTGTASTTLLNADTDGDSITNLAELQAGTNPAGDGTTATTTSGVASTTGCMVSTSSVSYLIGMLLVIFGFTILTKREQ